MRPDLSKLMSLAAMAKACAEAGTSVLVQWTETTRVLESWGEARFLWSGGSDAERPLRTMLHSQLQRYEAALTRALKATTALREELEPRESGGPPTC